MAEAAGPALARHAPAKINLFLHVVGRRSDGYHLLDSLVAFAALGDELGVEPAAALSLDVAGPFGAALGAGDDNLVLRAARALGPGLGARLTLTKNLPIASGIGGGSADAAAALLALRDFWRLPHDEAAIAALGLRLGADVPACLRGRPLWLRGVGEDLADAPALPPTHIVLVNPGVPLATPAVFAARAAGGAPPSAPGRAATASFATPHLLAAFLRDRRNDLEPVARFLCPPVDEALRALAAQPGCLLARMSGSGATCFGLFPTPLSAAHAAGKIAAAEPGWWSVATTLGQGPANP